MIVKIIRGSEITWYDCKRAIWVPFNIETDKTLIKSNLAIDTYDNDERIIETIDCIHPNAVYLMSNTGQTLDSMKW
jgi:hypothetical protein